MIKYLWLLLFCMPAMATSTGTAPIEHTKTDSVIVELAHMYQSSMSYIFQAQPLINSSKQDKSMLFGQTFINQVKRAHQDKFKRPFPTIDHPYKAVMVEVMIEVMEDNRTLIYDNDIDYKGFIPAIFAFQLSEKLSTKGLGIRIKFTSSEDRVRNKLSLPDQWETQVINKVRTHQLVEYLDNKAVYQGKPASRYFVPVKLNHFCLDCHGTPADNPANQGKAKSQWTNIDATGFVMENWQLNNFGGGVSVTLYEQ